LTLFFDISPEKARERGGYGEERYEKEEIQTRVRKVFRQLLDEAIGRDDCGKVVVIDAGDDVDTVKSAVWEQVQQFWDTAHPATGRLWRSHQDL
jgi:dTMP kinase